VTTDVYFLCGQGDAATSPGILSMADQARKMSARVKVFYWWQWASVITDIRSRKVNRQLAVSYSLGANALTWILGGVAAQGTNYPGSGATFDWAAFIDPTTLSNITPLDAHLKDGLHFHNNSLDPVGHGTIPLTPDFTGNLEVVETYLPHLALDVDGGIQARIMAEITSRLT
jgi:hypothetical protein